MPGIFGRLFGKGRQPGIEAAASPTLPVEPVPKTKTAQQSLPSYLTTAKPNETSPLPITDRRLANTNIEDYRTDGTQKLIRQLVAASPDLSAAVFSYIRTAVTSGYTAVAKNMDGTFNREATTLTQQILVRFDKVQRYTDGFSNVSGIRELSESLSKELLQYGALAGELVLDKSRLPYRIVPISVPQIDFVPQKVTGLRPRQKLGGQFIDLDQPTFIYIPLDQDLLTPYASSPLESAIQPVQFATSFMNDLRRVVKRAIHPRMKIEIDSEKFLKQVPAQVAADPAKLKEYMDNVTSGIEDKINGLNPEDALIMFDLIKPDYLNNGNISLDREYEVLSGIADAKLSTGAKTLPSILGHSRGSSNIASTETLLFMKNAIGAVQMKLNDFYSRMLTLSVRLFGLDVYVEFAYEKVDLRPESELAAFKSMDQSRILELLSIGFITDEQACMQLTGQLPPLGMKPLSGTMFHSVSAQPSGNPNNGTAGEAVNQTLEPKTPSKKRGNPKADVIPLIYGE